MEKSKYRIKRVIKMKESQKEIKNFEYDNKNNNKKEKVPENIYPQFKYQELINCEDISKEKNILEINKSKNIQKEYKKKNSNKIKVQLNSNGQINGKPDKINNINTKDINYLNNDKRLKLIKKERNTGSKLYLFENNASINESFKSKQEGDEIKSLRETYIKKIKSDEKILIIEPIKLIVLLVYFF